MTFTTMTAGELCVSPHNVRKNEHDANAVTGMAESLLNSGQLHPLVVHPMPREKGRKRIYGALTGGRRLRAFRKLIAEGKLPADHPINVTVRDGLSDGEIIKISLIENLDRLSLRDYEYYAGAAEAFAAGQTVEALAEGTGQTPRAIRQWIRLGSMAAPVFAALAEERITKEHAMAFAATEDHALQLHAFEQFMLRSAYERAQPGSAHLIRRLLKVGDAQETRLLRFVGEYVYREAGGHFELDMFADEAEHRGRVSDPALLLQLVEAKMERTRERLRAQAGRNLRFAADYPREGNYAVREIEITPQWAELPAEAEARAEQLREEMAEHEHRAAKVMENPDEAERAATIAAIDADYLPLEQELDAIEAGRTLILPQGDIFGTLIVEDGGELEIRWWWDSRKAKRAAQRAAGVEEAPASTFVSSLPATFVSSLPATGASAINTTANPGARQQADAAIRDEHGLSQDAIQTFRAIRREALRAALLLEARKGMRQDLGQDFLVWNLARDRFRFMSQATERGAAGLAVRNDVLPPTAGEQVRRTPASLLVRHAIEELKEHPSIAADDEEAAFAAFRAEDREWKRMVAALVAGMALERSANADGYRIPMHDVIARLSGFGSDEQLRTLIEPTEEMVEMMPRAQRLEQVKPLVSPLAFKGWEKAKAKDLVAPIARALSNAAAWVHPLLRFSAPAYRAEQVRAEAAEVSA